MSYFKTVVGSAIALVGMCALAADAPQTNPPQAKPPINNPNNPPPAAHTAMKPEMGANVTFAKTLPSRKIVGLNVRNQQGEKLGSIDDLVINLETGKVAYAALSVGGVLGIGDKLFAVPYSELTFEHGKDGLDVVLNVSKERLEAAPGFNKDQWPDFANPEWKNQVESYYRQTQANNRSRPASE